MDQSPKPRPATLEELEAEYRLLRPRAELFVAALCTTLIDILGSAGLTVSFPAQSRVKEWASFAEKHGRRQMKLPSIKELDDLVGVRLIFHFHRDAEATARLIQDRLGVIKQRSALSPLEPELFGYSSHHFVVWASANALATPAMAPFGGWRAEIQVRTTAQHIWADISHQLQYKRERSVPAGMRRAIYRASALLEAADLEFERVLIQRETYRARLGEHAATGPLNVDTLEALLDSWLPPANKVPGYEQYADLLEELEHFGLTTPEELRDLIDVFLATALKQEMNIVASHREMLAKGLSSGLQERLTAGVALAHSGLVRSMLEAKVGAEWLPYMRRKALERGF